jgi:glutathione S-transferase
MLRLFYTPGTCALASRIALEDAGAEYELVRVDFARQEQRSPDYLKINPKGRVPALSTDRGILTETPAILTYIAQTFPEAGLAPLDDAYALAEMQAFNAYLASTVHVNHAHGRRGGRWATDESSIADMKNKVPQTMAAAMDVIEFGQLEGPWVMGERYTVADPYLFTMARWLEGDGVDIDTLPRIKDHMDRMSMLESVKRALSDPA